MSADDICSRYKFHITLRLFRTRTTEGNLHVNTFWLFLKKRLTRTVERPSRFLTNSVLTKRPSPSPSSLLLASPQFPVTPEDDLSLFLRVAVMVSRDVRRRNSFSREHLSTLGLRLSLSRLE